MGCVLVLPDSDKSSQTRHVGQAKVLIAEDSAVTQDILKMLLEARGHEVRVAHDGGQALKLLTNGSFDIAFLDFHMPKLNGIDVVREFMAQDVRGHAPLFVAMTADVEGLNANEDCATTFPRILAKPFEFNDVFDLVDGCLIAEEEDDEDMAEAASAADVISIFRPENASAGPWPVVVSDKKMSRHPALPDIRYLAWPEDFGPNGFAPAISRQLISGRKYDAIVITESCEFSDLEMLWKTGELCLLPVLDQTGTFGPKADLNLTQVSGNGAGQETIVRCIDGFSFNRLKIHADLIRSKNPADRLLARIYLQGRKLSPVHHGDSLLGLVHAIALPDGKVIELAEELARNGLLERSFFDRFHRCPACQSSRLNAREECIHCRSGQLEDSSLIHHFSCAHQAPEEAFKQGADLVCPKCSHELRHFGIEYDKPGNVITCGSCSKASSDVAIGFTCLDCMTHTDGDTIETVDRHHYRISEKGIAYVEQGQMAIGVQTNLRFADLPLPLIVDINKAARTYNEDDIPFALLSIAYPLRHKLTAEHGAREFHLARSQFLRELRDDFDHLTKLHAGADIDYIVIFDVVPDALRRTLSERISNAQMTLKRKVMPAPVLFGPSDLSG